MYYGAPDDGEGTALVSSAKTNEMKKQIPKFKTEKDEAKFWDTHDSTDFLAQLEEDDGTVFVRPEIGLIEVRPATWRKLLVAAKRRRTTPQRLVQRWLEQGLTGPRQR